jgi:hypothetical protein
MRGLKKEDTELADALLENRNVTYLELNPAKFTRSSVEAMANMRTSKRLQRICLVEHWYDGGLTTVKRRLQQRVCQPAASAPVPKGALAARF